MDDSLLRLQNSERLSKVLKRIRLTPLGVAILVAALNLLINLPLAMHFGAWLPSAKSKGLAAEPSSWLYDFLIQPVILGYFCWLQTAIEQLFRELAHKRVLESEVHLQKVLTKFQKRLQSRWLSRIAAMLSLVFMAWFALAFTKSSIPSPSQSWVTVHPAIVWARIPVIVVAFYALIIDIYDLIIIIVALNDLLRNQKIRVEPFNPDKAGGLGSIGRFSANISYGIGALGLVLSVNVIQAPANLINLSDYTLVLMLSLYLLLAPIIFFLPLWTAHTAMVAYREHLLTEVSVEFDAVFTQLRALHLEDTCQNEPLLRKIRQLNELHMLINQFPVWPFNTESFRKFFSIVLSPLVPGVFSLIVDLLVKRI
jgi:hypothetical protein